MSVIALLVIELLLLFLSIFFMALTGVFAGIYEGTNDLIRYGLYLLAFLSFCFGIYIYLRLIIFVYTCQQKKKRTDENKH